MVRVWSATLLCALCIIAPAAMAATGFEYWPDADTLALWHFNENQGDEVLDTSPNGIESVVEGKADWDSNEEWNAAGSGGTSFIFDGSTVIAIPGDEKTVQPKNAITVEAWVYPEDLGGWKLICAQWGGAVVGSFHLGVEAGVPKFHINTGNGTAFAAASVSLELEQWQHVAGTYDSDTVRIYIDGEESGSAGHGGKLESGDPDFDVVIGSKSSREFQWRGLMDEVRISSKARDAAELSPNLSGPQAVEFSTNTLPIVWGSLKNH